MYPTMAALTIPEIVASIRERAGLTQEGFARELDVSFATVNSWERGRSVPRPFHVQRIHRYADALGIVRGLTVLVIDDDPVSCATISGILENLSIPATAITAQDGIEGRVLCGRHQPQLVLLDVLMPGVDGVEVAHRLQTLPDPDRPEVVFITAATDSETLDPVKATSHRLLRKPVGQTELAEVLASVAEKRATTAKTL